jgi:sugar phosphate isomerase/epimerase
MNNGLKSTYMFIICLFLILYCYSSEENLPNYSHPTTDVYPDWNLGIQLWTFHKYTFYEAIDKVASLGVSWVEAFPGQVLSQSQSDVRFDHNMDSKYRKRVLNDLAARGLKLVNYGVVGLPNNEDQCRQVFDFAKEMGIKTIVSEPPDEAWDLINKLCKEYEINVAIHNHPNPSHYWNPDKVLEVSKGRSKYIGACADIGHWMRSGVDPLEALKKLQGRLISLHFGDLNAFNDKKAHDVPWGTGVADIKSHLNELERQGFKGLFSIEYEYNWQSSVPDVRQSIAYFNQTVATIKGIKWKNLLTNDLSNCIYKPGSWEMKDGVLTANGGGDIWANERYGDFILDVEFKLADNTNSGIFVRTGNLKEWLHTAIEIQLLDSYGKNEVNKHDCGAIFDCLEPARINVRKPGEWNRFTITCIENKIYVVLNGQQIIDMDLNQWTDAHKNPDGTRNKFNTAYKDMPREGHIGFQYHGHPVWFRNIKIKSIN